MADWRNISDTEVDPDAPVTSELAYAFRDNVIAVTEGASGAPKVAAISAMSHEGIQGRIGTYALAVKETEGGGSDVVSFGSTRAGSILRPADVSGATSGSTLAGSWRCVGALSAPGPGPTATTLWLRIS